MPEPTPSQLKIDGIVTVLPGYGKDIHLEFNEFLKPKGYIFIGTISPLNPDAESFMVSVPRTELQGYKKSIDVYMEVIQRMQEERGENDKAYSDLAEQFNWTKEAYERLIRAYDLLAQVERSTAVSNIELQKVNVALRLRLEVKDSPIKAGLKRIWKWFKSTVNQ